MDHRGRKTTGLRLPDSENSILGRPHKCLEGCRASGTRVFYLFAAPAVNGWANLSRASGALLGHAGARPRAAIGHFTSRAILPGKNDDVSHCWRGPWRQISDDVFLPYFGQLYSYVIHGIRRQIAGNGGTF